MGLKENVILGHLVPAGTGFHTYQESEVRIRPEALEALAAERDRILTRTFPLLETADEGNGKQAAAEETKSTSSAAPAGSLDALLGGGNGGEPGGGE